MATALLMRQVMAGHHRAQEVCESPGGRPGLPVPNKPRVSVDVKQHFNQAGHQIKTWDWTQYRSGVILNELGHELVDLCCSPKNGWTIPKADNNNKF